MSNHASEPTLKNLPAYRFVEFWFSLSIAMLPIGVKSVISILQDDMPAKVLPSVLASVGENPSLMAAMLAFVLAMLLLHGLFGWLAWRLWRPLAQSLDYPASQTRLLGVLFFTALQGGILGLNSLLFPLSTLQVKMPWLLILFGSSGLATVLIWHAKRWLQYFKISHWHPGYVTLSLATLVLGGFLINSEAGRDVTTLRDSPDIIIIGLDSFRPDHLKQPGDTVSITPNLDAFLSKAYRFDRTYTPMARTYPAWMSILTGRYPTEHGARFNLLSPKYLKEPERSLPFLLKTKGYTTAYSIDETRFSNIDKRYGFDVTVTPATGAADFLLSSAADLPMSNLLNLAPKLQAVLFPYQAINRAAHNTYEPANFDDKLANLVNNVDPNHPLFLVTHFELPHWPFDWRDSVDYVAPQNPRLEKLSPIDYQKAVHRTDLQFAALIDTLNRNGRLENAIVVVLSDHGEGFFNFAPKWEPVDDNNRLALPPFALHGVNVLDESQTRVLMAYRTFSKDKSTLQGVSQRLASLVDVAPTLLNLAGMNKQELNASGCDLFAIRDSRQDCLVGRVVFTESGFYVPSLVENNALDQNKVAAEAYAYYDVNIDTHLTLKDDFLQQLFENKQRAAISDQIIVASLPILGDKQFVSGDLLQYTYQNLQNKPASSDVNQLISKLCQHFAGDDAALGSFCEQKNIRQPLKIPSPSGRGLG